MEIIHLGDFWNEEGIRSNREAVLKENAEVGRLFKRAYRYLRAAACVYKDNIDIYNQAVDRQKVAVKTANFIDEYFSKDNLTDYEGELRKLFATAITPRGLKSMLSSILNTETIIVLKGYPGTGTERFLEKVKETALERGYYVEAYYCALLPEKLEHLLIPDKDISITTSNKYHTVMAVEREVVDLNEYLNENMLKQYKDITEYNRLEFEGLLNRAISTIEEAKKVHDHMEKYYSPNMDFDAIAGCRERVVERILSYDDNKE